MKIYIFVLVLIIFLFSGCIDPCSTFGLCKQTAKVKTNEEQLGPRDVISVSNIRLLPSSPLPTDQSVLLTLILKNRDVQPMKTVENVIVELIDAPTFKSSIGKCNPLPQINCISNECNARNPCNLISGSEKEIYFNLITPSKKEIGNIITRVKLKFHILYNFISNTKFDAVVVNPLEIIRKEMEREVLTLKRFITYSSGPIRIEIEIKGQEYLLGNSDATIIVKIKDEGSGNIKENIILPNNMFVVFPKSIAKNIHYIEVPRLEISKKIYEVEEKTNIDCGSLKKEECINNPNCYFGSYIENGVIKKVKKGCFQCTPLVPCSAIVDSTSCEMCGKNRCIWSNNVCKTKEELVTEEKESIIVDVFKCFEKKNEIICKNIYPIEIFRDESMPLLFKLKSIPNVEIYKTYSIHANVTYTYELKESVDIEIRPE